MKTNISKRLWTAPNIITSLRIGGVFVLWGGWLYDAPWTLVLFVLLMCTDWADGAVARKFNMQSELGEILDPIADKFVVISSFIRALYVVALAGFASFAVLFVVALLIIAREVIVWIYRVNAQKKGIRTPSLFLGKVKVWAESISLIFFLATPNQWWSKYPIAVSSMSGLPVHIIGIIVAVCAVVLAFSSLWQLKKAYTELFEEFPSI